LSKTVRALIFAVLAVFIIFIGASLFGPTAGLLGTDQVKHLQTWELNDAITKKNIASATWQEHDFTGTFADTGQKFTAYVASPDQQAANPLAQDLRNNGIKYNVESAPFSSSLLGALSVLLFPLIIIVAIYFLVFRAGQAGSNQAMSFGRSRAKRVGETTPKITFEDIAGIDEAKQELFEIVDFLKSTKKYAALGAKIPKGVLLMGPPGVGKTHLARAIAGEAGVPFFHISGSDFVEMFVGVGAARVRDLFETAKAHRPSLIFIDEIDAVGRQRGAGLGGGHDEREQTLNQMLVEMDGFDANSGVIMIAATNRPDVLDPALLRPGRFDRQITVDRPDANGRHAILKIHSKGKPLDPNVNLEVIARRTPGFTGADLANTLNEAALLAARRNLTRIGQPEIDEAIDRVIAGPLKKSMLLDSKEREITAYHEAGHALLGEYCDKADPVHKVTILPRGRALGITWMVPERDKYMESMQELLDDIVVGLGGRVAEEIIFGEIFTGASSDLQHVTRVARAMVTVYGMSERVGALAIEHHSGNPFLGRDYYDQKDYSEDVAKIIDEEIRKIVDTCQQRALQILTDHKQALNDVAHALLEREQLSREELLAVMQGQTLPDLGIPPLMQGPENGTPIPPSQDARAVIAPKPGRLEPGPA